MGFSLKSLMGGSNNKKDQAPASAARATPARDPAMDAQSQVGNAAVQQHVAAQAAGPESEAPLLSAAQGPAPATSEHMVVSGDTRAIRPIDQRDAWSNTRERDGVDFAQDTQYAPEQLPKDPESVLAAQHPDWGLFIQACSNVSQPRRQAALQVVRGQKRWDDMLAQLGPQHLQHVNGWLLEDVGDQEKAPVEDRVAASANSGRAQAALSVVKSYQAKDPQGRLHDRMAELLALGVGMPANAKDPLGAEGILSVNSVDRACQALLAMPVQEYLRLSMLLELTGDSSRLQQSFLLLEATAARLGDFTQGAAADLEVLEGFSDDLRGLDEAAVVDQTSVTQSGKGDKSSLHNVFRNGEGAASAQLVAAEADPVKAMAMNKEAGLRRDALNTATAAEQESAQERMGKADQEAKARNASDVRARVIKILRMTACSPAEREAVTAWLNGAKVDEALVNSAIPKIQRSMGLSFPGAQAMRLAHESASGASTAQDLGLGGVAGELDTNGASASTGAEHEVETDHALVDKVETAKREFSAENLRAWAPHVQRILNRVGPQVDKGKDIVFEVKLENGGSHVMTFTNVELQQGRWLVHNTTNGKTAWVEQSAMLQGDWGALGVGRGILTSTIA